MDKIISKITAIGVPGLVLVIAISTSGFVGGAAIITALASLGPGGIIGGIITLGLIGIIADAISEYGIDAIFSGVVKGLVKKGETKETIFKKINKYPISKKLKSKLREEVSKVLKGRKVK